MTPSAEGAPTATPSRRHAPLASARVSAPTVSTGTPLWAVYAPALLAITSLREYAYPVQAYALPAYRRHTAPAAPQVST